MPEGDEGNRVPDPSEDAVFGNVNRLNRMLDSLDDRGLVLSLATFAEEALGDLIKTFLIPGDAADQLLAGFNAPLGTFSARIKMAFSLGLITERQHADLDRLRKIRNVFAHTWEPLSFDDQKVSTHITALNFSSLGERFPSSPHEKLRTSFGSLLTELRSVTDQIGKNGRRAKLIGHHLVAGFPEGTTLDVQIAAWKARFSEITDELETSSGERRRFLLHILQGWEARLDIVRRNAPKDRQREVSQLQNAISALNLLRDV